MLTKVDARNQYAAVLDLPLQDGPQYLVKPIDGLGPVKAEISSTTYVGMPGGIVQNARAGMRNIVLHLGYIADWAVSDDPYGDLRRALYPWFAPGNVITMHFYDTKLGELTTKECWVESMEPDIFSDDPQVVISIICPDPYFYALDRVLASRTGPGVLPIVNPGSAPTGFNLMVNGISTPAGTGIDILRTTPLQDDMKYVGSLYSQGLFLSVKITTLKGSKAASMAMSETYNAAYDDPDTVFVSPLNILGWIDDWIEVLPGANSFTVTFDTQNPSQNAKVSMSFVPRYLGL